MALVILAVFRIALILLRISRSDGISDYSSGSGEAAPPRRQSLVVLRTTAPSRGDPPHEGPSAATNQSRHHDAPTRRGMRAPVPEPFAHETVTARSGQGVAAGRSDGTERLAAGGAAP